LYFVYNFVQSRLRFAEEHELTSDFVKLACKKSIVSLGVGGGCKAVTAPSISKKMSCFAASDSFAGGFCALMALHTLLPAASQRPTALLAAFAH
jgi:hypothetical protein